MLKRPLVTYKVKSLGHVKAVSLTGRSQGTGPSRLDVTEQYKVHSASTVVFKAGPVPQERRRAASTRPRVQFLDDNTGSSAHHGTHLNDVGSRSWQAPSDSRGVITRSASLDPLQNRFSSDELEIDYGTSSQRGPISNDPAPPYPPADQNSFGSFLGIDSNVGGRSHSVASNSRITEPQSKYFIAQSVQDECRACTLGSPIPSRRNWTPEISYGSPASSVHSIRDTALSRTSSIEEVPEDGSDESVDNSAIRPGNIAYYGLSRIATSSSGRSSEQDYRGRSHSRFSFGKVVHVFETVKDHVRSRSPRDGSRPRSFVQEERGRSLTKGKGKAQVSTHGVGRALPQIGVAEPSVADGANDQSGDGWVVFPEGALLTYPLIT